MKGIGGIRSIVSLTVAVCLVHGKPYGDDNNDLYSNDEYEDADEVMSNVSGREQIVMELPKFQTKSMRLLINEGGTIRLPCVVDRLEGFVILWKKGDQIVTVGKQIVNPEHKNRFRLEEEDNGNELVIALAEEEDAGYYTCQISSYTPKEIRHSVKIRVKPEIRPIPDNGIIVAETGDSVTLGCQVTRGNPAPEVTWRRKERKMPNGEDEIRGLSLTYTSVTRHHSGIYICSADNGFGEPSTAVLKLDVQHAPEIEQEETFVHTREGDETELICMVHSSPRAQVTWYKNGEPLSADVGSAVRNVGNRHTLTVPVTSEDSFGQYSCRAQNQYGESQKTTELSGKAEPAVIKSQPKGSEYNRFLLEWTAVSYTPISNFKVEFKSLGDDKWKTDETTAIKLPNLEHSFSGSYVIPRLRPATVYMARVSSQNRYGYSDPSQAFKFATRGADPVQKPITGNGGAAGKSALTTTLITSLSSAATLLLLFL